MSVDNIVAFSACNYVCTIAPFNFVVVIRTFYLYYFKGILNFHRSLSVIIQIICIEKTNFPYSNQNIIAFCTRSVLVADANSSIFIVCYLKMSFWSPIYSCINTNPSNYCIVSRAI